MQQWHETSADWQVHDMDDELLNVEELCYQGGQFRLASFATYSAIVQPEDGKMVIEWLTVVPRRALHKISQRVGKPFIDAIAAHRRDARQLLPSADFYLESVIQYVRMIYLFRGFQAMALSRRGRIHWPPIYR